MGISDFGFSEVQRALLVGLVEDRTRDVFRSEVEDYLARARDTMGPHLERLAVDEGVGLVELRIANETDQNFAEVVMDIHISGAVGAYCDAGDVRDEFPQPPRPWGTRPPSILDRFGGNLILRRNYDPPPRPWISNGGSAAIRFPAKHLRPQGRVELDPVHVITGPAFAGTSITLDWSATATNASGVCRGNLILPIAEQRLDPLDLLRRPT
jgi:hypothetical protein